MYGRGVRSNGIVAMLWSIQSVLVDSRVGSSSSCGIKVSVYSMEFGDRLSRGTTAMNTLSIPEWLERFEASTTSKFIGAACAAPSA